MTETKQEEVLPKKLFGIKVGILYGIGCGIGSSIFVLLGTGIKVAGPGILISLVLGGILILLTALNYSELSTSLRPISGGAYNFSKEGLGGFLAFIIGFFLWIANIATCSFSAQAFALIIELFFPFLTPLVIPIAIFSILFTAIVVYRTQKLAVRTLVTLTIILIVIFSIFIISGLFFAPTLNVSGYNPEFLYSGINFLGVIQMFSLLFIFFTSITSNLAYFNSDLKNPSKNIPRVNILAILLTSILYLTISYVVLINIGNLTGELDESHVLLAFVLLEILGPFGFYLMSIAAIISTLIAMNAALGSAVSILYALARDNYVPKKLLEVNKKTKIPTLVLVITTIVASIFTMLAIAFANIGFTASMTSFIYFFGLAFINFAAVNLRYKRKELVRPFKAPFFPYLPVIVGSICLILAFVLEVNAILMGLIIFIIGITYYLLTLTDRHSIVLTLAGIKFFIIILVGILIWILNNLSTISSPILGLELIFHFVLLRILIFTCIFGLGTIILDLIPLREMTYFVIKKIDKDKVAINVGIGQIIELDKSKLKLIFNVNIITGVIQLISSVFIFILAYLFLINIISIEEIIVGHIIISQLTGEYIFIVSLFLFGIFLFFSGLLSLYLNREIKSLGI